MLRCRDATLLVSQSQDRPLKLGERLSVRVHLAICSACRNFEKQVVVLRAATRAFKRDDQR